MKRIYQKPKIEIVEIEVESLLAASKPGISNDPTDPDAGADAGAYRSNLWGDD